MHFTCSLWTGKFFLLNQGTIVSDVDENGKFVENYSNECSKIFLMLPPRVVKMQVSPEILGKGRTICHWKILVRTKRCPVICIMKLCKVTNCNLWFAFQGARNCLPNVTCFNSNLVGANPNSTVKDPCANDYLEIADGSFGYQKFCGSDGPVNVTTGRNARDIYLTLNLTFHAKNRAFQCIARCISDTDDVKIKPLEDSIAPLTNPHCSWALNEFDYKNGYMGILKCILIISKYV